MTLRIATDHPFSGLEEFVEENVPLARFTWYKIGGPARYLVRPRTVEELQSAVRRCGENNVKMHVLGLGANLLVGDEGVDGAVFRLDHDYWRTVTFEGNQVTANAGADMQRLLLSACRKGLSGIECLAGIPGTIGGGIRMNAGGKFGDLGSVVQKVIVMDLEGTVFERHRDDLMFDYRKTNIAAKFILGAVLDLEADEPEEITKRTKEIWFYKRNTQPLSTKNCGCIFKNPRGLSAGALIDQVGLKGMRVGGAEVSEKHANFIIAHPGCSAADIRQLMKVIQEKVFEQRQIELETEVQMW